MLVDLVSRVVADAVDREEWLVARRGGVTATEVRDVVLGRKSVAGLVGEKRSGVSLPDNRWFAWGRAREGVMLSWAGERFGAVAESRVFHAQDNSQYLASPDGLIEGEDGSLAVVECKTSKHWVMPGTVEFERAGYGLQMQWQMFVTGAVRALYVLEQHDDVWRDRGGVWPEPEPFVGPFGYEPAWEWVERDEAVIGRLRAAADRVLAALDGEEQAAECPEFEGPVARWLELDRREAALKAERAEVRRELEALVAARADGDKFVTETPVGRVSWSRTKPRESLDSARLRRELPDVWGKFVKRGEPGVRLQVTGLE